MWWWKKRNAKSSSVGERMPLLNIALEIGMCDDAIVDQLFSELDSTPESLLPAAMPKLTNTALTQPVVRIVMSRQPADKRP